MILLPYSGGLGANTAYQAVKDPAGVTVTGVKPMPGWAVYYSGQASLAYISSVDPITGGSAINSYVKSADWTVPIALRYGAKGLSISVTSTAGMVTGTIDFTTYTDTIGPPYPYFYKNDPTQGNMQLTGRPVFVNADSDPSIGTFSFQFYSTDTVWWFGGLYYTLFTFSGVDSTPYNYNCAKTASFYVKVGTLTFAGAWGVIASQDIWGISGSVCNATITAIAWP